MAQQQSNMIEQCLAALTDILNRQNQPQAILSRIEKEIRYLPTFEGRAGTLPAFITSVERALDDYGEQRNTVYSVIYNEKITGPAKNYLDTTTPVTWEECKRKLKLQYKPTKDNGRIVQDINNLKVSIIIMLLMMTSAVQGLLQVHQITENNGYVKIRVKDVEIANNTDIIIHMIDPNEIAMILEQLAENIKHLNNNDSKTLDTKLNIIRSKLKTIQSPNRQKRGLINIVGKASKWLFGTMDNDDRDEILEHLKDIDENNHNIIQDTNGQIKINDHFNKTFLYLKELIEDDRKIILQSIEKSNAHIKEITDKIKFLDQESKLNYLENKIDQILDNIVSTKNSIIHPSMLTSKELDLYKIDIHKLKLLKAGVMEYKNKLLIFAIKIPKDYIVIEMQIIKAIPNNNKLEIIEKDELIVEINNKIYCYDETKSLNDLKLSKHCIIDKKCSFRYNNLTSIEEIDGETILLKNLYNDSLIQNCDKRKYNLTGNFMINFNNCSIEIKNTKFYNNKIKILDRYFYQSENIEYINESKIDLKEIQINYERNIKEIKELKYQKHIIYGTNISITSISVIIVISLTL